MTILYQACEATTAPRVLAPAVLLGGSRQAEQWVVTTSGCCDRAHIVESVVALPMGPGGLLLWSFLEWLRYADTRFVVRRSAAPLPAWEGLSA